MRIRRVLEEAGGVYVKLGQIASTRPDLVPPEICAELAGLQNQVAPEPVERVREALEEELGADVDTLFAEFDWEPLAAGSIGQTYRACLRTGEPVVVKVQRPGIEDVMERDLAALALLAGVAQRRTPFGQGVRSAEMLAQFASSLRAELDFRREAEAMSEMTRTARSGIGGAGAEGLRRAVHPAAARAGALRRLHPRRHGHARRVRHRPAGARRAAVALHARAGAAHRLLPRRSPSRQHLRLRRRHPRPDRLRGRRAPRPGTAVGRDRHARRPRPPRRQPACATGSSGWRTCPSRLLRNGWNGPWPA